MAITRPAHRPSLRPSPHGARPHRARLDRARLRGSRSRAAGYWLVVIGLATLAGGSVAAALEEAREVTERMGRRERVWVAARPLAVGEVVAAGDVERRELPVGALPQAPLAGEVEGRVVRQPVVVGEALLDERLGPHGAAGPAALVDRGRRALTVPGHHQEATTQVGDLADLVAVTGLDGDTSVVARNARVVAIAEDGAVTVAVDDADVAATASAIVRGTVVLAVHRDP